MTGAACTIRAMELIDYDNVISLLSAVEGVVLRDADSREMIARYLVRNPGLSFVAVGGDGALVGCLMAGHDGRRGTLQHLAVAPAWRRQGIGRALAKRSLAALAAQGIHKVHLDVFRHNDAAQAFWTQLGWQRRQDIERYSFIQNGASNA